MGYISDRSWHIMRENRYREERSRRAKIGVGIGLLVVLAIIVAVPLISSYYGTKTRENVLVEDKERVCDGDSNGGTDCKYLIFTDTGTFRLTDSLIAGRFNSSDAYGRIKRCHRYDFKYYGWRFGLTSSYPNIKSFTDLGRDPNCEE